MKASNSTRMLNRQRKFTKDSLPTVLSSSPSHVRTKYNTPNLTCLTNSTAAGRTQEELMTLPLQMITLTTMRKEVIPINVSQSIVSVIRLVRSV